MKLINFLFLLVMLNIKQCAHDIGANVIYTYTHYTGRWVNKTALWFTQETLYILFQSLIPLFPGRLQGQLRKKKLSSSQSLSGYTSPRYFVSTFISLICRTPDNRDNLLFILFLSSQALHSYSNYSPRFYYLHTFNIRHSTFEKTSCNEQTDSK